ncbi:MAG: epimerase, partial [Ardenticatenaceae bacterium]
HMVEKRATGIYNAVGPDYPLTMQQCLTECQSTTGSDAHLTWLSEEFLLANNVSPFTEMPLWVPKNMSNLMTVNLQKPIHAGLTFRPLAQTIRDTLAWHATRPKEHEWRAGLTPAREQELLRGLR